MPRAASTDQIQHRKGRSVERTFSYTTDRVGNILEIVEQPACTPGPLVLENQTVTTAETFVSCTTIEAGTDFRIESPGDVTFNAPGTIVLKDGFSVGTGGRFVAGSGEVPELSHRTYTYQAPQYFLTGADGPWGTLDWTYDKIGNRLSEVRDGGSPDVYQYLVNGGAGNTPVLDVVQLGVTGTRDYTWSPAGHLEEVAAGANVLDFGADAEGRLSGVDRTTATETAAFSYDGRSFLRSASETAGGTNSVEPLYDSAGLVHALRRQLSPADPEELVVFLYLAGRPVAQLAIEGTATETWSYLITDHLGTPLVATDDAGAIAWQGGFEPFGQDYQQATPTGALESGVFLRLPGQWEDTSWQDATSGAEVYYNVHRWLEHQTGRYTRPDPLGLHAGLNLYLYTEANPVINRDLKGLEIYVCSRPAWGLHGVANHSYLWDPRPGVPTDRKYCGVFSAGQEGGPAVDACNYVPGSDGNEDTVMQCCRFIKKHSPPATYLPFGNDCQTGTAKALDCAGLDHPGVPGGRPGPSMRHLFNRSTPSTSSAEDSMSARHQRSHQEYRRYRVHMNCALAIGPLVFLLACGNSPERLPSAIARGDLASVKTSLEQGLDPNQIDDMGRSPLHWAAHFGESEVAELLLENEADVGVKGPLGTALHEAAWMGRTDVVRLLLNHEANPVEEGRDGETPLEMAVRGCASHPERQADYDATIEALKAVSTPDSLFEAVALGDKTFVRKMLDRGAAPNVRRGDGTSPLHLAAESADVEVVRELLTAGAQVNSRDGSGETPLHRAARWGSPEVARLLLEAGASINSSTAHKQTPLLIAVERGRTVTIQLLLAHRADPNLTDEFGWAPLHKAAASGDEALVDGLLSSGADPLLKNEGGLTPAAVARRYGHFEVARRLERD